MALADKVDPRSLSPKDLIAFVADQQTQGYGVAANSCLLYTSPSPRDRQKSRMPSSA